MHSERTSQQAFYGVSALLFATSAGMTKLVRVHVEGPRSMIWTRMPEQNWLSAATSFLRMWVIMMVAMMWPSLLPMLWRYRHAIDTTRGTPQNGLTALVALGYFFVWTVVGIAAFVAGLALAAAMEYQALARAVPYAISLAVLMANFNVLR